jgi:hypothetical protein
VHITQSEDIEDIDNGILHITYTHPLLASFRLSPASTLTLCTNKLVAIIINSPAAQDQKRAFFFASASRATAPSRPSACDRVSVVCLGLHTTSRRTWKTLETAASTHSIYSRPTNTLYRIASHRIASHRIPNTILHHPRRPCWRPLSFSCSRFHILGNCQW